MLLFAHDEFESNSKNIKTDLKGALAELNDWKGQHWVGVSTFLAFSTTTLTTRSVWSVQRVFDSRVQTDWTVRFRIRFV